MKHLIMGRAALHERDGSVVWQSGLLENALMNEGELDVLTVYLLEQAHKSKYLALLNMAGGADPLETDTVATLAASESKPPGTGGYTRQQVLSSDWATPALVGEDYRTQAAAAKVFGPLTGADATVTHMLLVTSASGTSSPATLALAHVALGTSVLIGVGLTFSFLPSIAAF